MRNTCIPKIISRRCIRSQNEIPEDHGCWKNYTGYCYRDGLQKFEFSSDIVGQDRYDFFYHRISDENGIFHDDKTLVFRRHENNGVVECWCEPFEALDSNSNSLFRFYIFGYINEQDKFKNVRLCCTRSTDGGKSFGPEMDLTADFFKRYPGQGRPLVSCSHLISSRDGSFKVPVCLKEKNPETWFCRVLSGRVNRDQSISWTWGNEIPLSDIPRVFMSEFSIAEISGDRLLAICRVSHLDNPEKDRKYYAVSPDGGNTWGKTQELKYEDGGTFYSPDSCGFLLRHSSGRLYYIANILKEDTKNLWITRSTISIVEINEDVPAAIRSTQTVIDSRQPDELPEVAMSNFSCFEERETGDIIVQCPKGLRKKLTRHDTDLMEYRIGISEKNR